MSFIGSILSAPAKLVEATCDALLPKKLEWMGDIASLGLNLSRANVFGAIEDLVDLADNVKKGDFKPEKLLEGLREALPIGCRPLFDLLVHPDPPPSLAATDKTAEASSAQKAAPATTSEPAATAGEAKADAARATEAKDSQIIGRLKSQDAKDFMRLSDQDLMAAIRSGNIPKEIAEDKGAMMAIQTRMHDMQQMNALLTNMMRALHEMQMEIIRNVRA